MTKTLPLTLVALTLQGCLINGVTKLNAQGSKVELVSETDKPSECTFLGKVTGTSNDDDAEQAKKGAENDLRNKAAALKGNFAVVENVRGKRDIVINGKAYDCKTMDMQLAEEEKHQKAIQDKEERDAKAQAEKDAKAEETKAKAEEAKSKREQADKDREAKDAAEKKDKKRKKNALED
jgi:hypothetical protein